MPHCILAGDAFQLNHCVQSATPFQATSMLLDDILASHLPTSRVPRLHAILLNPGAACTPALQGLAVLVALCSRALLCLHISLPQGRTPYYLCSHRECNARTAADGTGGRGACAHPGLPVASAGW